MNTTTEASVLRKAYNIGDDFYVRFIMGLGNIRSCVYGRDKQLEYDKSFHAVFQNLVEMRMAKDRYLATILNHREAIKAGTDGKYHGSQIDIHDPIDDDLNLFFKDFFIRGQMAVDGLIRHAGYMGSPIGFLFTDNEKKFQNGLRDFPLPEGDGRFKFLTEFTANHKTTWYSSFRAMRRKIEHDGWSLPPVSYTMTHDLKVLLRLPATSNGQSTEEMMEVCWINMTTFCEEMIVFLLSLKLKDHMMIVYIPEEKRNKDTPVRYMICLKGFPGVPLQC